MRLAIVVALCGVAHAEPMEPDDLPVPRGEPGTPGSLDRPTVEFTVATYADGSHSVRELRVRGQKLLDTTVTVRGVITWVYDCPTAIRRPRETERAVAKRIADDPTLCERPRFYVGDTAETAPEKSLWVVDVPRPYNKLELERIAKAERTLPDRCEPGAKISVCPPYKVGDVVALTGAFKINSPHAERNSDGLLVFGAMQNATRKWETPGTTWAVAGALVKPAASPLQAQPPGPPATVATPMRKVVDKKTRDESMTNVKIGFRAAASRQWTDARNSFQQAIEVWSGNHQAWFALGGTWAAQASWSEAATAFEHTVQLRPDAAMYQLWYGVTLYEKSVFAAREDQARRTNRLPEEVAVDLSAVNFERPLQHLVEALRLDPALWRAHYYVGRIERARGRAREAADAFAQAIRANARESGPYIALAELYRKWDYTDEAIAIAVAGTQSLPTSGDLWFVLGMAYDDKRQDARAIEAFTKAIDASPDHAKATFQRGQVYFRIGDRAKAKLDLEAFVAAAPAGLDFAKQQASAMLTDLAARK